MDRAEHADHHDQPSAGTVVTKDVPEQHHTNLGDPIHISFHSTRTLISNKKFYNDPPIHFDQKGKGCYPLPFLGHLLHRTGGLAWDCLFLFYFFFILTWRVPLHLE